MSIIIPPLDYIPKLPPIGVNAIVTELNKQIDVLVKQISDVLADTLNLEDNIKCDDPRIQALKRKLELITNLIQQVQQSIAKVQKVINQVKNVVATAKQIANAITAAQLLNPVTAGAFIASQLLLIQNQTVVNAVQSLQQFESLPSSILGKISSLLPPLLNAIASINSVCNGSGEAINVNLPPELISGTNITGATKQKINNLSTSSTIPSDVSLIANKKFLTGNYTIVQNKKTPSGYQELRVVVTNTLTNAVKDIAIGTIVYLTCPNGQIIEGEVINNRNRLNPGVFCIRSTKPLNSICSAAEGDIDYNDLVATEFYTDLNVSDTDLDDRSDAIEELLKQQQNLLTSLIEAPSKVYQGEGLPNNNIGKPGDYFVDTKTQQVYGPKVSINSWT